MMYIFIIKADYRHATVRFDGAALSAKVRMYFNVDDRCKFLIKIFQKILQLPHPPLPPFFGWQVCIQGL